MSTAPRPPLGFSSSLSRRHALRGASALALSTSLSPLFAGSARAIGPRSETGIGRIKTGSPDHRPEALRRLLWETGKRTSIHVARDAVDVDLGGSDDELFFQPLLVLASDAAMAPLDERARARLDRHLRFGGMLFIDTLGPNDPFAQSALSLLRQTLPSLPLAPLPDDHVLYKSFFLLDKAVGQRQTDERLWGIDIAGRTAVVVSHNDMLGAYERDRFGTWRYECVPDGEAQRERAFRLGVNVLVYATCLDYKADQVHIPFIMKKKRR